MSNLSSRKLVYSFFIVCSFVTLSAWAADERKPKVDAIASAYPLASNAGREILQKGGNAFDAAIAVAAALAVVEPNASGLGAGGFFLMHRASDGLDVMIDAREKAPAAASRDMFLDKQGNVIPRLSTKSALGAGIPGEPKALGLLAEKYGKLPLKTSLEPAIRLARDGYALYPRLQGGIRFNVDGFKTQPEIAKIFLQNGALPELGFVIKQPELAKSLQYLADHGIEAYYKGPFAKKLVAGVRKLGGIWTEKDLADYTVVERKPIIGEYRGARIISASPPSSGGIAVVDALHILEAYDLGKVDSATRKHLIIEAMRRAHRDRAEYLGDPDFVQIPVERLISRDYAEGQRTSLRLDRATPSATLAGIEGSPQGQQTTHYSILDHEGNRVAVTITLNLWFGAGLMIPETGIFLNDQMDDFSAKAGTPNAYRLVGAEANSIAPGKRPLSSSTPTFVESDKGLLITGSPGGNYIIGMVLLATLDFMDGKGANQIVATPRFNHQYLPDVVDYESDALTAAEKADLEKRGHVLKEGGRKWGNMAAITWDYASGKVEAATDPRGNGEGLVY
jgi:gamma-glutamyltranspeptidase/glutathione hydrolase